MYQSLRYDYIKKNSTDFLFFSAPLVKQGVGSSSSRVATQFVRGQKRKLSNKFFKTQQFYINNLIRYYFLQYASSFNRASRYPMPSLTKDVLFILSKNLCKSDFPHKDISKLIASLFYFNIFLPNGPLYKLSSLTLYFNSLTFSGKVKKPNSPFFSPYAIPAEIHSVFSSLRSDDQKGNKSLVELFNALEKL